MRSISKLFFVVVIFSTFFFTACGGEEPNLPDDESKTDTEVTDEVIDEEVLDETEDDVIDTESEIDEEDDSDVDDQEIVYKELESLDECLDSPCKNLCFLQWDEESGEEVKWHKLENEQVSSRYSRMSLEVETSHNLCYVNFINDGDLLIDFEGKVIAEVLPIKGSYKESYGAIIYFFLIDTEENFGEKKIYNWKEYTSCISLHTGEDWCEKTGKEKHTLEGLEGEYYIEEGYDIVPFP